MPTKKQTETDEIQISVSAPISEIPTAARGSHKFDGVIAATATLAKGKQFHFVAKGRSSVQSLKKRLEEKGFELTTRTQKDGSITVYVSNPRVRGKRTPCPMDFAYI